MELVLDYRNNLCYTRFVLCASGTDTKAYAGPLPVSSPVTGRKRRSRHAVYSFCKEGEQLENYTKYQLKAAEELSSVLADVDNLFVVA